MAGQISRPIDAAAAREPLNDNTASGLHCPLALYLIVDLKSWLMLQANLS